MIVVKVYKKTWTKLSYLKVIFYWIILWMYDLSTKYQLTFMLCGFVFLFHLFSSGQEILAPLSKLLQNKNLIQIKLYSESRKCLFPKMIGHNPTWSSQSQYFKSILYIFILMKRLSNIFCFARKKLIKLLHQF